MAAPGRTSRSRRIARRCVRAGAAWLAPLLAYLLRGLAWTWRVDTRGPDPFAGGRQAGALGALWHQGVLIAAACYRDSGVCVPVSRSGDGDMIVAVARHLGLGEAPRGSSRSGAVPVLRSLVRLVRSGRVVAILTDGPLGPARVSKPGVVQVASLAEVPIVPLALAARPRLRVPSWDGMLVPLPFARVVCQYGEPLAVPPGARGTRLEACRRGLDEQLEALTACADRAVRRGR